MSSVRARALRCSLGQVPRSSTMTAGQKQFPGMGSWYGDLYSGAKDVGKTLLMPFGLLADPCSIAHKIPGIKDMVRNYGCTAAGKAALATAITTQFPPAGPISTVIAEQCLCKAGGMGPGYAPGGYTPPPSSPFGNMSKSTLIGIAAAAVVLVVVLSKKKAASPSAAAAPSIILVSADAAKKS